MSGCSFVFYWYDSRCCAYERGASPDLSKKGTYSIYSAMLRRPVRHDDICTTWPHLKSDKCPVTEPAPIAVGYRPDTDLCYCDWTNTYGDLSDRVDRLLAACNRRVAYAGNPNACAYPGTWKYR